MDNKSKKERSKAEIYNDLKKEELAEVLGEIIGKIILSGFCGYSLFESFNSNVIKGIICGILLPFVIIMVSNRFNTGFIANFLLTFLWIVICDNMPITVGIIIILLIILNNVLKIFSVFRDRTEQVNRIYDWEHNKNFKMDRYKIGRYKPTIDQDNEITEFKLQKKNIIVIDAIKGFLKKSMKKMVVCVMSVMRKYILEKDMKMMILTYLDETRCLKIL